MRPFRYCLCATLLLACSATHATDYRLDTVHTQIFFSASHLGLSNPLGRLHLKNGQVQFDTDDWAKSHVDVTIDIASMDMGDAAWNRRLLSNEFLDADKFPTAHFVSERVEKTGEREGVAHGKLTLLGVTHPLDLKITFNRALVDPYTFRYTAGFSAEAKLKRSEFGMTKYLHEIGDEVSVRVEAEGLRGSGKSGQAPADKTNGT